MNSELSPITYLSLPTPSLHPRAKFASRYYEATAIALC